MKEGCSDGDETRSGTTMKKDTAFDDGSKQKTETIYILERLEANQKKQEKKQKKSD